MVNEGAVVSAHLGRAERAEPGCEFLRRDVPRFTTRNFERTFRATRPGSDRFFAVLGFEHGPMGDALDIEGGE